jgi:hypothetical protein
MTHDEANQTFGDGSGQPPVPTRAWVERPDGSTTELVLSPGDGPLEWIASPPGLEVIVVESGFHLGVDVLPAGGQVRFDRVYRPGAGGAGAATGGGDAAGVV